jgi:hypothetical protein
MMVLLFLTGKANKAPAKISMKENVRYRSGWSISGFSYKNNRAA